MSADQVPGPQVKAEEKKPLGWFFTTRKGIIFLTVLVMASILTVGLVVAAVRGSVKWEVATTLITGVLFAFVMQATKTGDNIVSEDNASKKSESPPKE